LRRRTLGLREQLAYIRLIWPRLDCRIAGSRLICRGSLKPLDVSSEYAIRIDYKVGANPSVWVDGLLAPDDESAHSKIPHRYRDGSICLFYGSEWTSDKAIAQTIVPWLLEWLMFYEGWLATGEWQGGGTHPYPSRESEAASPSQVRNKQ
jgi:hypothetical protein